MNNINSSCDTSQLIGREILSKVVPPLEKSDCNVQYGTLMSSESDQPATEEEIKAENKCKKLCGILRRLTIEPVVFCYMFAFFMNIACMSKMMMDKGCLYHYNYSPDTCKNMSHPEYKDVKDKVEILGTNFSMYLNCMSLIGAFFMIFIAPWSDKYSRKIPLLFALFGTTVTDIGFLLCAMHFEVRNEYLLLSKIPSEICGGFICILTVIYSHASEVSSKGFRTVKYALVETAFGLGVCAGGFVGGLLYRHYGYVHIYETATVLHIFCFLWVYFIVEETTGLDIKADWFEKLRDFFVLESMKGGVKAGFRRREGNQRAVLLLLIASMCLIVLTYESFGSIGFIYVHHIYNWDPATYNFVIVAFSLVQLPLTIILVPALIRIWKINDFTFGMIGTVSMILKNVLISFAKYYTFIYYLGYTTGVVSGLSTLAIRSSISKFVEKEELGRVFSFLATCEAIFPIVGTIGVTSIFTATLNVTPNIAYLVSAISLLLPLFTFIWATKSIRKSYLSLTSNNHIEKKT